MSNDIFVSVTGDDEFQREMATGIIKEAFEKEGFKNVTALNQAGEPVVTPRAKTMLDLLKQGRPDLCETTNIAIQGSFANGDKVRTEGGFGPVPVSYFAWSKEHGWEDIGECVDELLADSPHIFNTENIATLYIGEKDFQKWKGRINTPIEPENRIGNIREREDYEKTQRIIEDVSRSASAAMLARADMMIEVNNNQFFKDNHLKLVRDSDGSLNVLAKNIAEI